MEDDEKDIYQCNLCDKSYSYPGTLKTHMIMSHFEEDSYKCNQCDFLWISREDLKTHMQVHINETPESCNACELGGVGDMVEHNTIFHKENESTKVTNTRISHVISAKALLKLKEVLKVT